MSFYKSIFDNKAVITILEEKINGCYRISVHSLRKGQKDYELNNVPKSQVDMARHLKVTSSRLDKAAIGYLEDMWNHAYRDGAADEQFIWEDNEPQY